MNAIIFIFNCVEVFLAFFVGERLFVQQLKTLSAKRKAVKSPFFCGNKGTEKTVLYVLCAVLEIKR